MNITKDIKYIGVNDHSIDLFEGQYKVPNGMAYNSYVIMDEKIAVMDTVDAGLPTNGLTIFPMCSASVSRIILSFSIWSRIIPQILRIFFAFIRTRQL